MVHLPWIPLPNGKISLSKPHFILLLEKGLQRKINQKNKLQNHQRNAFFDIYSWLCLLVMPRTSLYSINQILILSHKNSAFHSKPFLNLNNFIPISAFSSSLQIIQDSESKSISNPLYHLLPRTQNPNNIVNLICSNLKQNTHLPLFQNELKGLLPHLGSHEISRVLLRFQSDSSSALTFFN